MSEFIKTYLDESVSIIKDLSIKSMEDLVIGLSQIKNNGGRLFILGVGGSAGHASHAVNDFRKICKIESYTPTDNVSELTARINDEGWDTSYSEWLKISRINSNDALLVFSVGGGNLEKNISVNLIKALEVAKINNTKIFSILGRNGGYTKTVSDVCVLIPVVSNDRITPHTEGFCSVVWHLLVNHPLLKEINE
jgi:D-sedoheptulose 7-phosphate isomerase